MTFTIDVTVTWTHGKYKNLSLRLRNNSHRSLL